MAEVNMTTVSAKGQVVIPQNFRDDFKEGDKLLVIKSEGRLIMKKATEFDEQLKEDLEFAKKTEEAWKAYDRGEFKTMEFDDFIEEMKKW